MRLNFVKRGVSIGILHPGIITTAIESTSMPTEMVADCHNCKRLIWPK